MRIIAGTLGGRLFAAPHGHHTHPMSDKMRGALFNMLGDISGLTVLDAFAGSGALSFEAVSRGAASSLAIENDRAAQRAVQENIQALGVARQVHLVRANARAWLNTADDIFDLLLLDPPYDALQGPLLELLAGRLRSGGRLVLSWPGKLAPPALGRLTLVSSKNYGDGSLHVYT
jgi:16S rRNA (guanine966-N2)-methyltransferase